MFEAKLNNLLSFNQSTKMKQEKKRIRSVWKYHFENVKICVETDVVFTRCRVCKELKPSNLEYFRKDPDKDAQRLIQPICRECAKKIEREQREIEKTQKIESEKPINHVEQKELFENVQEETIESKVDRILSFLWLNKWKYKK